MQVDGTQSKWFAIADLVAHVLFQGNGQHERGKFICFQGSEIYAKVKLRIVIERLNKAIGGVAAKRDRARSSERVHLRGVVEVELAPRDVFSRFIEVKGFVMGFRLYKHSRIHGIVFVHFIRIRYGVTNIDFAEEDAACALFEHAEGATGDAELRI